MSKISDLRSMISFLVLHFPLDATPPVILPAPFHGEKPARATKNLLFENSLPALPAKPVIASQIGPARRRRDETYLVLHRREPREEKPDEATKGVVVATKQSRVQQILRPYGLRTKYPSLRPRTDWPYFVFYLRVFSFKHGPCRIRTCGHRIKNPVLCLLS